MSAPTNHWKLGLFVVVCLCLAAASIFYLGAQSLQKVTLDYKSYFDESVQGLEVGSPLKFRGVTIGNVSGIDVAPDHRHVEVTLAIAVDQLKQMGLAVPNNRKLAMRMPRDIRAQIASAGITGVKFITIDYFNIKEFPAPKLPFQVPQNTIPVAASTMKNLEDAVLKTINQIPDITKQVRDMLTTLNNFVIEVDAQGIAKNAGETLKTANTTLKEIRAVIHDMNAPQISNQLQHVLTRIDGLVQKLDGEKGLVLSARRTSEAFGDIARGGRGLGRELEATLREIRETAASIRRLTDALEKDPDMLLKGRAKGTP